METITQTCKKFLWINSCDGRYLWIVPNEKTSIRKAKKELKKRDRTRMEEKRRRDAAPTIVMRINATPEQLACVFYGNLLNA